MESERIDTVAHFITFRDKFAVKKGDRCTVLRSLPNGLGGELIEVRFDKKGGGTRWVRRTDLQGGGDCEESQQV